MALLWAVLSAILLVYLLRQLLGQKNRKKLPPGPRGLPILGHFHLLGKHPHVNLRNLARKHGPVMGLRLGPVSAVIVSSPAAAELVLKTHDLVFASRPPHDAARQLSYEQRNLVFGPYGPYWRNMRKLCTFQLLSGFKINQFSSMRRAEVGLLVGSLKRAAEGGESVDLSAAISAVNGDMNCLMIFGRKYSDGDFDEEGFRALFMETVAVAAQFNLADFFPYVGSLDLQGLNRRMKRLSKAFDGFLERIIDDHVAKRGEEERSEDFVDTMMAIMESGEAGFEFDRRHIKAVLLDLLIAGTDTSAAVIEWAMSELMRHPTVMKKLQQELESVVGLDQMVEESHIDKLKYLDCVVKEVMRLHPVVTLLLPRESMEDCELHGFYIPKKSRVIVNAWAIGRDPDVWADPDSFTPERFIDSDIDLRGRHFELIPFGSGRRGCPGLQLGLTVVKLVVAQLVHCFDWELPNGMKPSEIDMSKHFGLVTARVKHLMAIPSYRLHMS
ncbi:cytochrome P450 71AU50-like [Salvia splendens]|uniref:cytochrome P450 71AU50-like n=1 Tax=Salvia splendens TaxID=180675 RepID=UPI001C263CA5|nr:cytochrome P450 71AU50-like [Salvia splendens]